MDEKGEITMKKKLILIFAGVLALAVAAAAVWFFAFHLPDVREKKERQQIVADYYAMKVAMYAQENEKYEDYEVDVAFLGDSLTDGYDLERYYPQFVTVNRGIGGDTTFGLEKRMQVSVYDLKPKVVVMLIGANNLHNMFDNYENLLIGLRDNLPETKVVLVSLTSMGMDWAHMNQLAAYNNVKIKLLAEKYGYSYVDLYAALFNLETGEIRAEYTTDGGHQTHEGYEVFTANITPVVTALLNTWEE
jgi:lysophospholipase L1-like esterase